MRKKTVLRMIILAFIIIWMITTFQFSNQNGDASSSLSKGVASLLVPEEKIAMIEPYIRKIAHLSEYAIRRKFIFLFLFNVCYQPSKKNDFFFIDWDRICFA